MNLTCIAFGILFFLTGILFAHGKLHTHTDAWKRMPKEERDNIDILPLCGNIGGMISLSGLLFLTAGFCKPFLDHCFVISMILWMVLGFFDVWYIQKDNRYQKEN